MIYVSTNQELSRLCMSNMSPGWGYWLICALSIRGVSGRRVFSINVICYLGIMLEYLCHPKPYSKYTQQHHICLSCLLAWGTCPESLPPGQRQHCFADTFSLL